MKPSREDILNFMRGSTYRPLSYGELVEAMGIEDHASFAKILGRMEKDGDIVVTRKHRYGLPEHMNLVRGVIQVNPRGFAFLIPDDPEKPDVYIYGRDLNGAMHNDRVLVRLNRPSGGGGERPEGEVVRAVKRAHREVVGTYKKGRHMPQVIPDDPRLIYPIYVKPVRKVKVKEGDKVLVRITVWPDKDKYPEGHIVDVLGSKGEPGVDILCLVRKYGLSDSFPREVLKEADRIPSFVLPQELEGRVDLRELDIVTIDGEDAKDLDDAVWVRKEEKGYTLGVHIADVSHYVKEGSALDKEAYRRGTSVYLVDRVLPMLPPSLSNGICSLNAGEDRLAMSVVMELDNQGEIVDYEIFRSVIRVKERMTYTDVNRILKERDKSLILRYKNLVDMLVEMQELAACLREKRMQRGALDFDFPETKVVLGENGVPLVVEKRVHDVAESIIEEFMIKANEVVAYHLFARSVPTLYRVHERPDKEALDGIRQILGLFGRKLPKGEVTPGMVSKVLKEVKGAPEERFISSMILRSMKHARYSPLPLGHFGLASQYYVHFTSPIRRYPDLVVHRGLTCLLDKGRMSEKKKEAWGEGMGRIGEHCTLREIGAEEAEREAVSIKVAQYMQQFLGEVFSGIISSVTAFGFFVELENTAEGLVHISSLVDDYYVFDDRQLVLVGRHTRKIFRIGDRVKVQLVKVNVDEAKIDFELVEKER